MRNLIEKSNWEIDTLRANIYISLTWLSTLYILFIWAHHLLCTFYLFASCRYFPNSIIFSMLMFCCYSFVTVTVSLPAFHVFFFNNCSSDKHLNEWGIKLFYLNFFLNVKHIMISISVSINILLIIYWSCPYVCLSSCLSVSHIVHDTFLRNK